MRILLAEDEDKLARYIKRGLEEAAYTVDLASDGEEAIWLAENHGFDAAVLDVMMPGRDGFSVVRQLRRQGFTFPILFLSARHEVENRIRGLDAGGDDYLTKPFSMEELLARLRALLRRQRPNQSNALCVGALQMDLLSRQVQYAGESIELTNKEFALLELLMTHAPSPVTKTKMIEQVWNQHFDSGTNLINVYVNRLRGKIETGKAAGVSIRTIRGVGFALVDHKES